MVRVDLDFIHGIPGGGKNDQIKLLLRQFPHAALIYPGELIRQAFNSTNPYHSAVAPHIAVTKKGHIAVPPDVVGNIVIKEVEEALDNGSTRFFFDGFPRGLDYLSQKDRVIEIAKRRGHHVVEKHIYLSVDEQSARRRLLQATRGRDDDTAIDTRMAEFTSKTLPMIDELRRRGQLCEVDGEGTIREVNQRIRRCLS